jgi:Txe/YoeB family toxin of Txe-Axe toxin-antitoxin module
MRTKYWGEDSTKVRQQLRKVDKNISPNPWKNGKKSQRKLKKNFSNVFRTKISVSLSIGSATPSN